MFLDPASHKTKEISKMITLKNPYIAINPWNQISHSEIRYVQWSNALRQPLGGPIDFFHIMLLATFAGFCSIVVCWHRFLNNIALGLQMQKCKSQVKIHKWHDGAGFHILSIRYRSIHPCLFLSKQHLSIFYEISHLLSWIWNKAVERGVMLLHFTENFITFDFPCSLFSLFCKPSYWLLPEYTVYK